jgi:flagellin-like hook-associated protein FlgL
MLSANAPIYGSLSQATGKAMLSLQRSTSKALSVNATEVAISNGNSGDASYSARLSSLSDRKRVEVQNIQNFLTYAQIQDAGLENVLRVMDRMASIAGASANAMVSTSERSLYNAEFESLKETLFDMQGTKFQGHYLFQESVDFDSGLSETEQNPIAPDTYEHRNVDSTDDTVYSGRGDLSRWTATKDVRYDRGTLTMKVNSGTAPERYYIKQGANNIIFDSSWWKTAGNAYDQDFDQFVVQYSPGTQTTYSYSTLDSDSDGNIDNAPYNSGSGGSMRNSQGDPIITRPAMANETQLSVIIESRSLFQAEARFDATLSSDVLSVEVGGQKIDLSPAMFSTLYDASVESKENASNAGSRILDEIQNTLNQRGDLAALTNDLSLSADRLSSYFIAEQSSIAKRERDYADTAIDLVKKNLRSDVTSSLLVQARGINRDLVNKLL